MKMNCSSGRRAIIYIYGNSRNVIIISIIIIILEYIVYNIICTISNRSAAGLEHYMLMKNTQL